MKADASKSGTTLIERPALQALLEKAKKRPRELGCVLVDDIEHLARNLNTALQIIDELRHAGVYVHDVSRELDHDKKTFGNYSS